MKSIFVFCSLAIFLYFMGNLNCFAQQRINHLIFNSTENIVGLNFRHDSEPQIYYTGIKANSTIGEGIAHAENDEGEIIFWVNSNGIYDKNNNLMPGSVGIFAHPSSTEITICPFPDADNRYYVFYNNQLCSGLYYSVVNIAERNNLGDVTLLNIPLMPEINFAEGIEVVRIPCSRNFWLIANECGKGLRKFKIDETGIHGGELFGIATNDYGGRGELDYHMGKIGYAITFNNKAHFVNFNPLTGEDSNYQTVVFPSLNGVYGLEFSANGSKVFTTDISNRDIFGNPVGDNLFAYDFNTRETESWAIKNDNPDCPSQMEGLGHIELGKDGNMYVSQINGCQIVKVEQPESNNPTIRKINVTTTLSAGISDHIQTDFLEEDLIQDVTIKVRGELFFCGEHEKTLYTEQNDSKLMFQWYKDGIPIEEAQNSDLPVNEAGRYQLLVSNPSGCSTWSNEIQIEDRRIPNWTYQERYMACLGEAVILESGIEGMKVSWSNGAIGEHNEVRESGVYSFTVDNGYCVESRSIEVVIQQDTHLNIPNVITPNGDDFNEFLTITGEYDSIGILIYNRWGKLVYFSENYQNNWKGEGLPKGTYYYNIQTNNMCTEKRRGWITIL